MRKYNLQEKVFLNINEKGKPPNYVLGEISSQTISITSGMPDKEIYGVHRWVGHRGGNKILLSYGGISLAKDPEKIKPFNEVIKTGTRVSVLGAQIHHTSSNIDPTKKYSGSILVVGGSNILDRYPIVIFDDEDIMGGEVSYKISGWKSSDLLKELEKIKTPNLKNKSFYCVNIYHLEFEIEKQKEKTMSKIVDVLKADGKEAAYRVAGTQITNGVKAGIVKLIESKGGKSDQVQMLKDLLDTEVGGSVVALILGFGLQYAPGLKDDPRIQKLSEEFRVHGMSIAGNAVITQAAESFLPVLTSALKALPEVEASGARLAEEEEEEEEDVAPPVKIAKTASR